MIATMTIILIVQATSQLFMMLIIHVFRQQKSKYVVLLQNMGNDTALGTPGRILIPIYGFVTVMVAGMTLFLFVFQPHIL